MRIVAEKLNFSYGKTSAVDKVLDEVTLTVEEGEVFGIIGHTGSGKSTFIQHLNGLIKTDKKDGKLFVGDFDLSEKKCNYKELRKRVGMVFQYPEAQLFAETVEDDVAFALKNFFPDITEDEKTAKIRNALYLLGLDYDKVKDKSPFDLSGGQRRRVAIAGVIVAEPEVLILDEPVAGLDPQGKRELSELLKRLHEKAVKTIVIVSHDMNTVAETCDRAAIFTRGKVVAEGSPKEIFNNTEIIENAGLELPVTAYLTQQLERAGIVIDNDYTVDGFIKAVSEYCEKTGAGK